MRGVKRLGAGAVGLALAVVVGGGATAAVAETDPTDGGLWYATGTSIPKVHEITRGAGMTIAVIDGPVNASAPDLVGTNLVVRPEGFCANMLGEFTSGTSTRLDAEHATSVISMLLGTGVGVGGQRGVIGIAPEATVLAYNIHPDNVDPLAPEDQAPCMVDTQYGTLDSTQEAIAKAIDQAVTDGADIISISVNIANGAGGEASNAALIRAYQEGVIVVAGVRNEGTRLMGWPADANGVVAVEMTDLDGNLIDPSMADPFLAVLAPGVDIRCVSWADGTWSQYVLRTGSSYATPFVAGSLALAWSQHPDATANQMIQAMARNTNGEPDHGLVRNNQRGYGSVATLTMVQSPAESYPDENPLLHPLGRFGANDVTPYTDDILGYPTPSASPSVSPSVPAVSPKPEDTDPDLAPEEDAGPPWVVIGIGAVVLVVLVVTLVFVVVARRRRSVAGPAGLAPVRPDNSFQQ